MLGAMSQPRNRTSAHTEKGVLGLGFDAEDGHKRVTQGDEFLLIGGSRETHERMQDVVMRMEERLKRKGKSFREISRDEFADLAGDVMSD